MADILSQKSIPAAKIPQGSSGCQKTSTSFMVFGQLFDKDGNPIVVAVRIYSSNRRNHISVVNKVRSVGTRSHNLDALLSEDKLLYLSENKKEAKEWFNALGRSTPFGGTKFGLIRSISTSGEKVNAKFSLKAYSDAEKKQHVADAKAFFGKTYKWAETDYITTLTNWIHSELCFSLYAHRGERIKTVIAKPVRRLVVAISLRTIVSSLTEIPTPVTSVTGSQ